MLNTSFNENEPVVLCTRSLDVCNPEEAVSCLLRTKMDALADHAVGAKRHWEFFGGEVGERVEIGDW